MEESLEGAGGRRFQRESANGLKNLVALGSSGAGVEDPKRGREKT